MKNPFKFLLFLLLLIAANNVSAQKFTPGIIAGALATDVVGIDPTDTDFHKVGFTLGGLLNAKLSDKNSLQFEILYTRKGSLQPADSSNNYVLYNLSLDYIEVPVLYKRKIQFNIGKKTMDRFYLEIGPSFGRLLKTTINTNGNYYFAGNFKKNEIAINLGAGAKLINNLYFNVRFSNSILSVVDHLNPDNGFFFATFNKGHNMVFSFTLRYLFDTTTKSN
jgi:Outer membrane protein beta-barrel domain